MARRRRLATLATWLALTAALAHCGDAGQAADDTLPLPARSPADDGDGDAHDASASDADAPPACDPAKPFGTPALLPGLDGSEFRAVPRLSPDELTVYFTILTETDGALQADLSRAVRTTRTSAFAPATPLDAINTLTQDNDPMISSDRLSLWFSSWRSGGVSQIFVANRPSTDQDFGPQEVLPVLLGAPPNAHPYFRPEGPELWFTSDRTDSGFDIYRSPLLDGSFAAPSRVSELSSPGTDAHPQLSPDGLRVFFTSDRAGGGGPGGGGGFDMWIATRSATTETFRAPSPVTELNTTSDEYAGWMSPDGCRAYFSSNRETDAQPRHRLWFASRPK